MMSFVCGICKNELDLSFEDSKCEFCNSKICIHCANNVVCLVCESIACGKCGNDCEHCKGYFCFNCISAIDDACPYDDCSSNMNISCDCCDYVPYD